MHSGAFELTDLPEHATASLRGYVGSIAANRQTGQIAISSPRGGVAFSFDPATLAILDTRNAPDLCGIAAWAAGFRFSSGDGLFDTARHDVGFDNHLAAL